MNRTNLVVFAAAFIVLVASACKKNQAEEKAPAEAQAPVGADVQAAAEPEAPAADAKPETGSSTDGAKAAPSEWVEVSATTPKGVKVSFRVPGYWVEVPPPNDSTLLVRGARYEDEAGGTIASLVAVEFEGDRDDLVKHTKERLAGLASLLGERPLPIGDIDGYELTAKWNESGGGKETIQLLVATGQEAIGVSCKLLPGTLETLSGLCSEIFASVSVEGLEPAKKRKP